MAPKEKAIELFDKFNKPDKTYYPYVNNAQECALIAVDEILINTKSLVEQNHPSIKYWQEVKQEIEKL